MRRRDMRTQIIVAVFAHGDQIAMPITNTDRGAQVKETSTDPYAVRLIRAHAEVVNSVLGARYGRGASQSSPARTILTFDHEERL